MKIQSYARLIDEWVEETENSTEFVIIFSGQLPVIFPVTNSTIWFSADLAKRLQVQWNWFPWPFLIDYQSPSIILCFFSDQVSRVSPVFQLSIIHLSCLSRLELTGPYMHGQVLIVGNERKKVAYVLKRVATGAHILTSWIFNLRNAQVKEPNTAWSALSFSNANTRYSFLRLRRVLQPKMGANIATFRPNAHS